VLEVDAEPTTRLTMERGVSQLLFNYLPGRTVDWEDGLAIVQLTNVRLSSVWEDSRAQMVRREVSAYLARWRERGGSVAPNFPDPVQRADRVTVGEPVAIAAATLETALICQRCSRLVFVRWKDLARKNPPDLTCPSCKSRTLRQFGQVFVHGCGELLAVTEWLPQMPKDENGNYVLRPRPLRCQRCADGGIPELPSRTERARDMTVSCRVCKGVIADRLTARCPACAQQFVGTSGADSDTSPRRATPVAEVVMRLANYRANETYYPHTITILRLDRPRPPGRRDPSAESLLALLPIGRRPGEATGADRLVEIAGQIAAAEAAGNAVEAGRLRTQLVEAATRPAVPVVTTGTGEVALTDSVARGIEESIALRETVEIVEASKIAAEGRAASALHREEITEIMDRLGLAELSLVRDLPIITSTFGFTRRAFTPTYDEEALGATGLSTQLRAFYPLDNWAARRQGRPDLAGTIPLLAREAEHEGILFRLDPNRTFQWLAGNGALGETPCSSIVDLLPRLEPVDRYYDDIWNASVHRWVFGLIHTMAHSAMRVVARLAGLERTSIAEYLFLPLLGFVIFANGSAGDLGNLETVLRDHQLELLQELALEGVQCIYDPDCIDRGGACHGCVHSPEICCRAFNHGLSRALLLGGHVPWVSSAIESDCVGYW
jgi:hypothetical protein